MYSVTRTVEPTSEPVTLTEAKAHCRIDTTADDTLVSSLITAARLWCESRLGQQIMPATYRCKIDAFTSHVVELPYPPLTAVSSITYVDSSGSTQTLSSAMYTTDTDSKPGRVFSVYAETWPTTRDQLQAITITYTAGYASESVVPQPIKQAILLLVGHWYENREASVVGVTSAPLVTAVESLLSSVWHGSYSFAGVTQ